MQTQSPFDRVREELGLTVKGLAEACAVPYTSVYNGLRGYTVIPRRALEALADLGVDTVALRAEQRQWTEQRAQAARAALKQRLQGAA